ncbi:MAG: HAD-IA family hydrolase [Deferrisomatales bacterium]
MRLLLLDCDGVLVRSERANVAYYNHLFRHFGLPAVDETDREAVGLLHTLSTPQVIDRFFPPPLRGAASRYAAGVAYDRFLECLQAEPGWDEVLARWRSRGLAAVATNRGTSARAVLAGVGLLDHLDLVLTVRDVARPKPAPDLLVEALRRLDVEPREALYVGDSELDRQAAEAAGVLFLGFRTPRPPSAGSPREVEKHLDSLARGRVFDSLLPSTT